MLGFRATFRGQRENHCERDGLTSDGNVSARISAGSVRRGELVRLVMA